MKGIDISNNNHILDFNEIKNAGIEAVIIKATEGVYYVDPNLELNYQGVKSLGVHLGFYHFMSERSAPVKQAEDFYAAIKDKSFDIIPVLDIETNQLDRNATEITDRCLEFLNRFKELSGYDCVIYTGGYFGRDNLDIRLKGKYKGWIAHYGVNAPMETGFTVVGHQYTEKGSINGISPSVDMNNFIDDILIGNATMVRVPEPSVSSIDQWVAELQNECNTQGFSSQVVDGIPGPITLKGCPVLKKGCKGSITKLLQKKLNSLGFNCGTADGIFGNMTFNAVCAYQKSLGLNADGIVGNRTWGCLL